MRSLCPMSRMVTEQAFAKINLTLHVTGQRDDGYHLLDSLVVFASIGDRLDVAPAAVSSLMLEGPFGAEVPADMDNLVLRAARLFAPSQGFAFTLQKHLPPASGIGGGSADAAAAIRGVVRLMVAGGEGSAVEDSLHQIDRDKVLRLGADVPICLFSHPARMRGIGERISFVKTPECWITLVNPRVEVPTPQVFKALTTKQHPAMPDALPDWPDATALAAWLRGQRNDLQAPAQAIAPVITDVLTSLQAQPGTLIARMSGSGATCFALFADAAGAKAASAAIGRNHPDWWVADGSVFPGSKAAELNQLMRETT